MTAQGLTPRVALLVNLVAPYRVSLYDEIARYLDLEVLYSGHEDNRPGWEGADRGLKRANARRVWGWVLKLKRPAAEGPAGSGEPFDVRYLHVTPGYGFDLLRYRPDAIISSELGVRTAVALVYGLLAGIPVWVMIESSLHTERSPGVLRSLVRGVITRCTRRWIAVGECTTEYLASLDVPPSRITTIQDTVDERPFRDAWRLARATNQKPVALCVGQLVPRKGVGLLLDALAALAARGIHLDLLIAGDGPERSRLEARARELGLSGVSFLGQQTTSEVAALFRRADFLVFPTLEDVWGLVVNEALWSGLPVLASRYAGCAQELLPAENIFDPLDEDSFVGALERASVEGLAPADQTPLWSTAMAARRVAMTVLGTLGVPVPFLLDPVTRS
jgi:glycosyltransferase involved in cell wall biosynthesis